jgi:hypothetical protein
LCHQTLTLYAFLWSFLIFQAVSSAATGVSSADAASLTPPQSACQKHMTHYAAKALALARPFVKEDVDDNEGDDADDEGAPAPLELDTSTLTGVWKDQCRCCQCCHLHLCYLHSAHANLSINVQLYTPITHYSHTITLELHSTSRITDGLGVFVTHTAASDADVEAGAYDAFYARALQGQVCLHDAGNE